MSQTLRRTEINRRRQRHVKLKKLRAKLAKATTTEEKQRIAGVIRKISPEAVASVAPPQPAAAKG